ncbi:hypothetical protein MKLM6_0857 [Methylomonas koyamae]|nr:hypothetical protein MKLM6_0857 [Methylomonas koyamae]
MHHSERTDISESRKDHAGRWCKSFVNMISESPLLNVKADRRTSYIKTTARSLKNIDFVRTYDMILKNAPDIFHEYLEIEKNSSENAFSLSLKNKELESFLYQNQSNLFSYQEAYLSINLHANDEQIIDDFRHWLSNIRELVNKKSAKKDFCESDFNEWAEYKVLPYIDLKIWSMLCERKITQSMIARALYPDEYEIDITERIRKTTKKKADWLMRGSVIDAFGVQLQKTKKVE